MRLWKSTAVSLMLVQAAGMAALATGSGDLNHTTSRPASQAAKPASKSPSGPLISYHEDIEPIFKQVCGSCHSVDKHMSGFVVETPESLFKGGSKSGAHVILPGKASESAIIGYLRGRMQPAMPLNSPSLNEKTLSKIETWINQGAKVDQLKLGWPYTPPVARAIPAVKNSAWVKTPVDNFILSKLELNGLKPAPPASRVALLRRVYADLVGEPPTPDETIAFVTSSDPKAYEKLVDALLADPRYGERWGRHWLDLVRFAETHGYENDGIRPRAWRFRDYVIRSFNSDKPYNRFLEEQIAGDELFPNDADAIIATGYARLGPWDELSRDGDQRWQDYLTDVTDTTGSVMLGLSLGCARCHNHKYDRITQADYYRMQSFFVQTRWNDARLPNTDVDSTVAAAKRRLESLNSDLKKLRESYRPAAIAAKQKREPNNTHIEVNDGEVEDFIRQTDREAVDRLHDRIREAEETIAPLDSVAEAISDEGRQGKTGHILLRGNLLTPGPAVEPGFIASLDGNTVKPAVIVPPANSNTTGRRSALALWLGSRDNPMTARVIVNRLWQHHFGRGIVASPSDFGRNGDKATHPELLDWLAIQLMDNGWSLKKIHRMMVLSNTYQMSTSLDPQNVKVDPTNALFWRMNRIRLEGEPLRDTILAISGRLNPQMYGPSVYPHVSDEVLSTGSTHKWGSSPEDQGRRRTIYVFQRRSLILPIVEAFDGPDITNTCPRRAVTTIAPQALALFNGEFSREESKYFADRVINEAGTDTASEIDRAYLIALSRKPTPGQRQLALDFIEKQTGIHLGTNSQAANGTHNLPSVRQPGFRTAVLITPDSKTEAEAHERALADFCHVLINTNEFIYLD